MSVTRPPVHIMHGFVFLLVVVAGCVAEQPRVVTENGVVVGRIATSRYGRTFKSFQGIPYAKPPTAENRFKEPQRLDGKWMGEWNATTPGSRCLQHDHYTRTRREDGSLEFHVVGDEDCLFLNVYTSTEGPAKKDVIFLIHGGAFMFGSGIDYGPEYLMEDDAIVYVTINYRLGPLGFLSTGDSEVPGNNGLKDQVAALQWVNRNINAFGGDSNKVSLVGLSAGGASVHYQFLSPLSNGLFNRGYSYSGTSVCNWALVKDGVQKTKRLASLLGCPTSNSKTIVNCLRKRPATQIVQQMKHFQVWLYNPYTVFGPVIEVGSTKPFIDQHPRDILAQGKSKDLPWVSGVTSEDGLYNAADFVDDSQLLKQLNDNWRTYAPYLLFYNTTFPKSKHNQVADNIKEAYFGGKSISRETVKEIIALMSDRLFIAPGIEGAILQARQNTQPVHLYMYRHLGTKSLSQLLSGTQTLFGVCHGDDIAYSVKFLDFDTHVSQQDKAVADVMSNILLTFVKTGEVPSSLGWKPVSKQTDLSGAFTYLNIKPGAVTELRTDTDIGNLPVLRKFLGDDKTVARDEL